MRKLYLFILALFCAVGVSGQNLVAKINTTSVYRIKCNHNDYANDNHKENGNVCMYYIGETATGFDGTVKTEDACSFIFEKAATDGQFYIKSAKTGKYLSYTSANKPTMVESNPSPWIVTLGGVNYFWIKCPANNLYLNNALNDSDTGMEDLRIANAQGICSQWMIYEVGYRQNITEAGWSTIYLGSNATIPASGVTVYGVTVSGDKAMLNQVTGVIEANRGYLVNANLGNYDFYYTTDEASSVESQLLGSTADENVAKETNYTHYVLSKVNGVVGFYAVQYNQESDTKFKNNANRAYLKVANSNARMLTFDFGTETGIEAVEAAETAGSAAVYDLCGRRVQAVKKGLYIAGGRVIIK